MSTKKQQQTKQVVKPTEVTVENKSIQDVETPPSPTYIGYLIGASMFRKDN